MITYFMALLKYPFPICAYFFPCEIQVIFFFVYTSFKFCLKLVYILYLVLVVWCYL